MLVILTTTPDLGEAERIAQLLVTERLAACVQVLPSMTSFYAWEGAMQREREHLLLIKTLEERFEAVRDFIIEHHTYEVPEIVAIAAEKVSDSYLKWITDYVGPTGEETS